METTKYYLPLESKNLAHYFAKACICPVDYIENRNEDIQNFFPNYILLSNKKFVQNTNCSLEIILTDVEKLKNISENFFLYEKPLPITRVKRVFFKDKIQKTQTLFDINSGAAFLPDNLIEIDTTTENFDTIQLNNINKISNNSYEEQLKSFNKILGGFSLMKISSNENSYPVDYFHTLATLNQLIKEELINQEVFFTRDYEWVLKRNQKLGEVFDAIYSKIDLNTINQFASKDDIEIEKKNGRIVFDSMKKDSHTYNITVLGSYGEGTRMTIDSFVSDLVSNKFPPEKKEGLSLTFGINQGYEVFRNKYQTQNFEADIKFKLDSQLDYYTIESIYQFVFNSKQNNKIFEYLDWCPKYIESTNYKINTESFDIIDRKFKK